MWLQRFRLKSFSSAFLMYFYGVCVRAFPIPPCPGPLILLLLFMISLQHPPVTRGNSHRWVFVIFRWGHYSVLVDCLFSSHTLCLLLLSAVVCFLLFIYFFLHRIDSMHGSCCFNHSVFKWCSSGAQRDLDGAAVQTAPKPLHLD